MGLAFCVYILSKTTIFLFKIAVPYGYISENINPMLGGAVFGTGLIWFGILYGFVVLNYRGTIKISDIIIHLYKLFKNILKNLKSGLYRFCS